MVVHADSEKAPQFVNVQALADEPLTPFLEKADPMLSQKEERSSRKRADGHISAVEARLHTEVDKALAHSENDKLKRLARLSVLSSSRSLRTRTWCHFLNIPTAKASAYLPLVSEFWQAPNRSRSRSRTRSPDGRYALARQWFFWSPFSEEGLPASEQYNLSEYFSLFTEEDRRRLSMPHSDEEQVRLDIDRSFINYPKGIGSKQRDQLKALLHDLIIGTLRLRPSLRYFQGFHDIISVIVVELDLDLIRMHELVERFTLHWCRDGMGVGLEPILGWLRLVQKVLIAVDVDLAVIVERTSPEPFFALSWILTLFAHDVSSQSSIARLFDIWITEGPQALIYFCVALVLSKKQQLIEFVDSDDFDDNIGNLHAILAHIPDSLDGDIPQLIETMLSIKQRYPLNHPFVDVDAMMGAQSVLRSPPLSMSDDTAEFTTRKVENLVRQPLPSIEIPASAVVMRNKAHRLKLMHRSRVKWAVTLSVTVSAILFGYYTRRRPAVDIIGTLKSTFSALKD